MTYPNARVSDTLTVKNNDHLNNSDLASSALSHNALPSGAIVGLRS